MPQSRFETGLRHFMRRKAGGEHTLKTSASAGAPSPWRARVRRVMKPVLPLFSAFRRYMNGPLADRLWEFEARQTALLRNDNQAMRERMEQLEVKMGSLVAQHDRLSAHVTAFGGRFDEIEVKIRPPLDFGDATALRLGDGYVLVPKDEPAFLLMLADATTGGLEPGTRKVIQRLLLPGMKAVDVGANIGLLTMASARAVGASGKVYAFEPEDRMADLTTRTLALNGLSWVELRREAAGAKQEEKSFHVSKIPGHSSLYELPQEEEGTVQKVRVIRLDDVIPASERIDLVKIDVEGAELDVFAGMERIVADNPDLAIIAEYGPSHLERVGLTSKDWFDAFGKHGFKPHAISEPYGEAKPASIKDLTGVVSVNIVFTRQGSAAEARLLGKAGRP